MGHYLPRGVQLALAICGFDLGLFMTFESKAAIEAYDPHPLHGKVIEVLQRVTKDFHGFYFEDF